MIRPLLRRRSAAPILPGMRALVAALALAVSPGAPAAADAAALETAETCAAFWLGRDDHARRSAVLDRDPTDPTRAAAYRAVAVRLSGDAARVDAVLAAERRVMGRLFWAVIAGDRSSTRLHNRLLDRCAAFAATQPETRALP